MGEWHFVSYASGVLIFVPPLKMDVSCTFFERRVLVPSVFFLLCLRFFHMLSPRHVALATLVTLVTLVPLVTLVILVTNVQVARDVW